MGCKVQQKIVPIFDLNPSKYVTTKKYFIAITFLFVVSIATAQKYQSGKITLTAGEKKSGLIKPPTSPDEKNIEYKTDEKAEVVKYPSEEVKEVLITVDGIDQRFVRAQTRRPKKWEPKSDEEFKYSKTEQWLVEMVSGSATLYATGPIMKVKEDGRVRISYNWTGHGVPPDINFWGTKSDMKTPTWVAFYSSNTMGQIKIFKRMAAWFFSDHPTLPARLEKGEFKNTDIADVFEEYNKWKAGKK